jgi:hypothetical protein
VPGRPTIRSEPVAVTLFGLGALVFLSGVFFVRIAEVTLPGGAGFKLAPSAQSRVVEKVAQAAQSEGRLDPQTLRKFYEATVEELARAWPYAASAPAPAVGYERASRAPRGPTDTHPGASDANGRRHRGSCEGRYSARGQSE